MLGISLVLSGGVAGAVNASDTMAERLRTDPLMMPYYTGNILPTPQKVDYSNTFIPMADVAIVVGKDVENPAPLVEVLIDRIMRYGGKATVVDVPGAGYTALVSLGDTVIASQAKGLPAVPEKEQGYVLHAAWGAGKPLIILKGHDRLGLLWAISSLAQLIHWRDGQTVARAASVEDYPYLAQRGYIHGDAYQLFVSEDGHGGLKGPNPDTELLLKNNRQMLLLCKFNTPVYQTDAAWGGWEHPEWGYWRTPEKWAPGFKIPMVERLGTLLTPLGITWYAGIRPHVGSPENKLCGNEETLQAMLWYARRAEAAGGHLGIQLDDTRFPLHSYDKEHYGTACKADTWLFTNLMVSVKKEYPKARLLVCPPFYWGPGGNVPPWYGESRDDYLRAIGEHWQPEIDIFWTGTEVSSVMATKGEVAWVTGLIKRKPFFWQNSVIACPALYWTHDGATPVKAFRDNNWDGFLDSLGSFGLNSRMPVILNAISADYAWNPKAYDPERSVREAASKMMGPEAWPTLQKMGYWLNCLWPFYSEGRCVNVGPEEKKRAAMSLDWIEKFVSEGKVAMDNLEKGFPAATKYWGVDWRKFFYIHQCMVDNIKNDPKLAPYRAAIAQKAKAKAAGEFENDNDGFYGACQFTGGLLTEYSDPLSQEKNTVQALADASKTGCTLQFGVGPSENAGKPHLVLLNARLGDRPSKVVITVNGRKVFDGDKPFNSQDWATVRVSLPGEWVKAGVNVMAVTFRDAGGDANEVPSSPGDYRMMIRYAVVKKIKE